MAGVDLWAAHFGLTGTPFTKTIPANELFDRAAHAEAVARIHYCINEAALGVLVGDTGAGKTVAVRAALAALDRTKFTLVYPSNPSGGCRGMYVAIATALGATPRFHKAEAINQAAALLAAEEHERHRRVIFVIDEAHLLSPEQLEELRLLSNAELDSASPFAGILIGQPTLATRLRQGIFAALDHASASATPSAEWIWPSPSDICATTSIAGRNDPLIADDAAARLHRYANGLPRALNNAATAAHMAAAADVKSVVDDACAKKSHRRAHQNLRPPHAAAPATPGPSSVGRRCCASPHSYAERSSLKRAKRLSSKVAGDRWTWLVVVAYTQLRLARGLVDDIRMSWERPTDPAKLTPARVRRGFHRLRATIGTPARPPKSDTPGPGRPKGNRRPPRTRYPAIKRQPVQSDQGLIAS